MKRIKLFKESFTQDNYYQIMSSESEMEEVSDKFFISGIGGHKDVTGDKFKSHVVKKLKEIGFYENTNINRLWKDYSKGMILIVYDDYDDYYYVKTSPNNKSYKCDQFDGLLYLIKDLKLDLMVGDIGKNTYDILSEGKSNHFNDLELKTIKEIISRNAMWCSVRVSTDDGLKDSIYPYDRIYEFYFQDPIDFFYFHIKKIDDFYLIRWTNQLRDSKFMYRFNLWKDVENFIREKNIIK